MAEVTAGARKANRPQTAPLPRVLRVGAAEREAPALRGARQKRHGLGHVFALLLRARRRRAGSGSEKAAMKIAVQDRKERSRVFMGWDHQSV